MNLLTPFEKEVLELLEDILVTFGAGRVRRTAYLHMMGQINAMKNRLVNRMFGCASGRHCGACGCERKVA